MKFNPEDVRRMQANRMVAEAKRILSSSQELSRIQYADITSMLQKVDLKDLNSDGLILLQDCRKLVIKREKRVELSKSTVPAAEEESGPALSATPKSIVTTKPSIQADAAPSSSANSDVEETTSGERIHALLQARKDLHERELQKEGARKTALLDDIVQLTSALKETTTAVSQSVRHQNVQLDEIQQFAVVNAEELDRQRKRLRDRSAGMTSSLFGNISTVIWVVAIFVLTYVIIVFFPRSSHALPWQTCSAKS